MIQPNRMMATAMPMKPAVIRRKSEETPAERAYTSAGQQVYNNLKDSGENMTQTCSVCSAVSVTDTLVQF